MYAPRCHRDRHFFPRDVGRPFPAAAPGSRDDGAEVAMERGAHFAALRPAMTKFRHRVLARLASVRTDLPCSVEARAFANRRFAVSIAASIRCACARQTQSQIGRSSVSAGRTASRGNDLVGGAGHGHVRHAGQQDATPRGAGFCLARPRLATRRVGDLGCHQARGVRFLAARRQLLRNVRILLHDQSLDRRARIDGEAHQTSSR